MHSFLPASQLTLACIPLALQSGLSRAAGASLELAAADIVQRRTLVPEIFDGVTSVVCCTAVKVVPKEGDTVDRKKYYQVWLCFTKGGLNRRFRLHGSARRMACRRVPRFTPRNATQWGWHCGYGKLVCSLNARWIRRADVHNAPRLHVAVPRLAVNPISIP